MKNLLFSLIAFLALSGCARISPLSPQLEQRLDNQNGQIEDIKNNQNGLMTEIGKIRNQNELNAQNIRDAQQGIVNLKGNENSGIQILQGDGALILIFALTSMAMFLVYHYKTRADKAGKAADILAQQIALHNDLDLDDKVFLSALNTDVEKEVYQVMTRNQSFVRKA